MLSLTSSFPHAFALFALLTIASLSAQKMVILGQAMFSSSFGFNLPITVWRMKLFLLYAGFFCGAAPDALILMVYGQDLHVVPDWAHMLDRAMDGMTLLPFLCAVFISIRSVPIIEFQLTRQPIPMDLWPTWRSILPQIRATFFVLVITLGITLAK
jgi:hypothetical protein